MRNMKDNLISITSNLFKKFQNENFCGYDPFDFLNSKVFKYFPFSNFKLTKLIFTQFGKRFFINLRPLFFVSKSRNPKGIALVILGLIENYNRTKNVDFLSDAKYLVNWLLNSKCDKKKWKFNCWGYNFQWQAKAFNVPLGTPNIVTTYFASLAIYKLAKALNDNKLLNEALESAYFINHFLLHADDSGLRFNYVPNSSSFVHNANLFGAHLCILAGTIKNDKKLIYNSVNAIKYSLKDQKKNGSWVYGNQTHHQWIDSFHTGYNLELLYEINNILKNEKYLQAINLGYKYYLDTFIMKDGRVKYYDKSLYPLDVHSYSQAIITIKKIEPNNKKVLNKIVNSLINEMYLTKEERFIYQKRNFFSNKIDYFRWTQAWAYYSLCFYNN